MQNQRVVVCGGGEMAAAKLRLLLKTQASIEVFSTAPCESVESWAQAGRLQLHYRQLEPSDLTKFATRLVYVALEDEHELMRALTISREADVLSAVVDNLELSDFITPAMVDRSPVTVAIGTEGNAPVLGRRIKARIEEMLRTDLCKLASIAAGCRDRVKALPGHVDLVGAGPGDPELLTLKARRLLNNADVIVHDRLVSQEVLELAPREARFIDVGKAPGLKGWTQNAINELLIELAQAGEQVVRLKSGDPGMFGRLDEEMSALQTAQVSFDIVPGITAAVAAAAAARVSMTRRDRNSSVRFLTGQDINGFAEHEWKSLAKPGAVAAVYMGLAAIPFLQSRLLIHGASGNTPISLIENASRASQVILSTTLHALPNSIKSAALTGPAVILLGLHSPVGIVNTGDASENLLLQAIA